MWRSIRRTGRWPSRTLQPNEAVGGEWVTTAHTWTSRAEHAPGRAPFAAVLIQAQPKGGDAFLVTLQELGGGMSTETESGQR